MSIGNTCIFSKWTNAPHNHYETDLALHVHFYVHFYDCNLNKIALRKYECNELTDFILKNERVKIL